MNEPRTAAVGIALDAMHVAGSLGCGEYEAAMPRTSAKGCSPLSAQSPSQTARLWLLSITGWTLISGLLVLQDGLSRKIHSRDPANWLEFISWELGWTMWGLITPCVVAFARRHRVSASANRRVWLYHAGGVLLTVAVQIGGEVIEVFLLARSLGARPPLSNLLISTVFMRWHLDLLLYAATVAVAQAVWLRREAADLALQASQMEARLAEARLDTLKSQIHPHFLFNTLHAIAALILKSENRLALEMLSRLSDFLRVVLEHADIQRVSLKEELDLLRLYTDIQRVRFGGRLNVSVDVPAELLSAEVPYLLLQPLVENAIKHGVERHASAGAIEVRAWEEDESMHLLVKNDGGEFSAGALRERVGLKNTRQRLQLLYGERQHVELRPVPEGGAVVEIVLPMPEVRFSPAEVLNEEVPAR